MGELLSSEIEFRSEVFQLMVVGQSGSRPKREVAIRITALEPGGVLG
ncbi:hypothetical protein QF034_000048 [Streptomyces africanus]|uniref:Uncharacterized protein n=1 Tax=Streptomyces africanus TaxID=231024 RepID=A0ABU0QEK3_9ACTN|nr:hypothetical protein [Streptomyces africanus]MDQ0745817.1 hypothetical protein [Streptomyces africanus]